MPVVSASPQWFGNHLPPLAICSRRHRGASTGHTCAVFDHDSGWIVLPGVLGPAAAAALALKCEQSLVTLETDPARSTLPGADTSGAGPTSDLLDRVPEARSVMENPRVVAMVEEILGPGSGQPTVTYRAPRPGFGAQKLHSDALPRLDRADAAVATAVAALCDFTPYNGATRIVPGSHDRPDLQRLSGSLDAHPDEMLLLGPAGTVFAFNGHLLHSGTLNLSEEPRPSLQIVWRRDGVER